MRYSKTSSGVRRSGSETISTSGVPQRFRSMYVLRDGVGEAVVDALAGIFFHVQPA